MEQSVCPIGCFRKGFNIRAAFSRQEKIVHLNKPVFTPFCLLAQLYWLSSLISWWWNPTTLSSDICDLHLWNLFVNRALDLNLKRSFVSHHFTRIFLLKRMNALNVTLS